MTDVDVVVVGSGPNGLAAAITMARAGRSVVVVEQADEVGGATRSGELTLPGYVHDLGSAIHPLALASPFMATIDWEEHGLRWLKPPAAVAHPLEQEPAVMAWNDLERTTDALGDDAAAYRRLFGSAAERFDELVDMVMRPLPAMARVVLGHPVRAARFGPLLSVPAAAMAKAFSTRAARALLAGHAAHSVAPFTQPFTGGFALLLGSSVHAVGWPFPAGGAGEIARVLTETLVETGGEVITGHAVSSVDDLPSAGQVIFALTPAQIAGIDGMADELPPAMMKRLATYRYGAGACKVDYLVEGPIPWSDPTVQQAATVHVGGPYGQVAAAEAEVGRGRLPDRPFVLLAQHSGFDPSRAPEGSNLRTVWAYCHVPLRSERDVSDRIEAQIERFAPGFRATIRHRHVTPAATMERWNPNLVGGDIAGGSTLGLRSVLRPWPSLHPNHLYGRYFIGSAATSPGGGVHGMGGLAAATAALADAG